VKLKTVLITAATMGVITAGTLVAVLHFGVGRSSSATVNVVRVETLNNSWWDSDDQTIEGNIISKDSQNVQLNTDYELTKVYVKEGEEVKKGDPLLEYDMSMLQLRLEVEELNGQRLEMELTSSEKNLEKELKSPGAAAIYAKIEKSTEETKTKSADDAQVLVEESLDAPQLMAEDDLVGVDTSGGIFIEEDAGIIDDGLDNTDSVNDETLPQTDPSVPQDEGDIGLETDGSIVEPLIDDPDGDDDIQFETDDLGNPLDETATEREETSEEEFLTEVVSDEIDFGTDYTMIRVKITEFLTLEDMIRTYQYADYLESGDISELNEKDIADALAIFEKELSATPSKKHGTIAEFTDAFGEEREENKYVLSTQTKEALKDLEKQYADTESPFYAKNAEANLYKAYLNLISYDLILKTAQLEKTMAETGVDPENITPEQAAALRTLITAATDSYYRFDVNRSLIFSILEKDYGYTEKELDDLKKEYDDIAMPYAGENMKLGDGSDGTLSKLIASLNDTDIVQETEPVTETPETQAPVPTQTEAMTEDYGDYDDYGDDYYDDEEEDEETMEETIRNLYTAIVETKLSIRENDLKIKEYKRKLAGQTVKAEMDGVVKTAGTIDEPSADDNFIIITGESGMYVEGTIGELDRETIEVGDVLTGYSAETGASFTATVTEVSEYPQTGDNYNFWGYGGEGKNQNVSQYPFTAYIEDADNLTEGSASMQFVRKNRETTGITIDAAFVRTDEQGREYVLKADENGLLKKQIISTTLAPYGVGLKIKTGLTGSDKIAFPYGKGVVEGARTVEVENFDMLYSAGGIG